MIGSRKFKIWLISTCIILAVFVFFRIFGDTVNIKTPKNEYQNIRQDANGQSADANSGRIGQARVEYVGLARFETIDPKTRKLKRVVGFQKVLHKTGDEWQLDKPYMNVYQENIRCDITADTGLVEIENVEGANPSPKQAIMKGNVVVHILGQGNRSDSYIYLNEVAFDSDRSMLWSKDDVNFVSEDADMLGKGLEIVYNNSNNRMEFFKIKEVEYLNIKAIPKELKDKKAAETKSGETAETVQAASNPSLTTSAKDANEKDDYRCLFRDNVRIEYKDEVIMADEISVSNLLRSQNKDKKNHPQANSTPASPNSPFVQSVPQPVVPAEKRIVIATVRCTGPMIIRPVDAKDYEERKPAVFKGFNELSSKTLKSLGQRNLLIAEKIDYDVATETATAIGKNELVFYPQVQTAAGRQKVPFVISAKEGAEFSGPRKQAVFFGNVKGVFVEQKPEYTEENVFYGSKLTADLAASRKSNDIMASSDISHITILGPNVRLESAKTVGKTKLSHVRLKSEQIDYERTTKAITAAGKGRIEYSNTAKMSRSTSEQTKLDKPCYSLVEGFTKLVWDTNTMHVQATSEKTAGIHIGYLPVLDTGGYGPRTAIDTKQLDIDYFEPTPGKSQLKKLVASNGIVYQEQGGNEFAGRELVYNAADSYMTVSGSKEMPCMLNGAFTEGIEYDLKTGTANPVFGGGVGIMPTK